MSVYSRNIECSNCGNKEMASDYDYTKEELSEFCDVCGHYHTIALTNKHDYGKYPADWQPKYQRNEGITGYVIKIFQEGTNEYMVIPVEKQNLMPMLKDLRDNQLVIKFSVTCKNENGLYQTQIFKKN